jgi:hypothetical protein
MAALKPSGCRHAPRDATTPPSSTSPVAKHPPRRPPRSPTRKGATAARRESQDWELQIRTRGKGAEEESPAAALLVSRSGCADDVVMGWIRRRDGARVYPARVTSAGDMSGTLLSRCGCERYHNLLVIINLSTG